MRENELADLLIRMASDRGIDVESAAEELASIALPSFVDARRFRSAVLQALETNLRAQVEERLQSIRRRFDVDPPKQGTPPPRHVVSTPTPAPAVGALRSATAMDSLPDLADVTMAEMTPVADAEPAAAAEEELPTDATMVWTTRHG